MSRARLDPTGWSRRQIAVTIAVIAIISVLVFAFVVVPLTVPALTMTQLWVKDAEGNKIILFPGGWTVGGVEATTVGVDYQWTAQGNVDRVQFTYEIFEMEWDPATGSPTWQRVNSMTQELDSPQPTGQGACGWNLENYFANYKDGETYVFKIKGYAQAEWQGSPAGDQLQAESATFSVQWVEADAPGGLTGFVITLY